MARVERPQDFPEMHFEFTPVTDSGLVVLATQKLAVGYGKHNNLAGQKQAETNVLVRVADLELLRGDRVGLIGPNGVGKTTLLRTLIGELPPLSGQVVPGHNVRIGYYSQTHTGLTMERSILDEIRQVSTLSEEGARSFLGRFLFSGDDVFKSIGSLSGGERSRVALAKLTLQGPNLMVLDEPTNHLDLQSRQFLEEVLNEFEGTLLFVSHDRYFIDSLATKVWAVEDGVLIPYMGNYTEYRTRKRPIVLDVPAPAQKTKKATNETKSATPIKTQSKKGARVKVRTVEDVERDIERAEEHVKSLEEALTQAALNADAAQLTQLSAEHEQARIRVDELLTEWEQLADAVS
jgi:ATP-binding cassette subfamily F protein 3